MRPTSLFLVLSTAVVSLGWAQTSGFTNMTDALYNLCAQLMGILPPLAMLLVVLGALFYAAGKLVPNPEFAGRASGLAAAAIAAAVICLVMVLLMPSVLSAIMPSADFSCSIGTLVP